jgi:Short C-terminal domain
MQRGPARATLAVAKKGGLNMRMRRRRPLMRAAMVGGTAYYAGKRVQEGREEDAYRDAQIAELQAQQAAQQSAPAPAASGGLSADTINQLKQLGELKEQGVLTEEEFEAQKQKLLGAT